MIPESRDEIPRGFRFQAGLPAAVLGGAEERPCLALNLSRSGVLLVGRGIDPAGDSIEFEIRAPSGGLAQRFVGRVARVERDEGEGTVEVAVEFLELDPDQRRHLEQLVSRVMEGMSPGPLEALRPGAPPHEVRKAIEAVPLAHRIALAGRAGPREREFLRLDPHPTVLESLARNPNVLVTEIRSLLASAHVTPSTLEIIATDPRWSRDGEIRLLVATHPNVPFPLADRIVAALERPALKRLVGHPTLHPTLRDKVVKRLARG